MRSVIKRVVERALSRGGAVSVARRFTRGRALVLAYHNILPHGAEPVGERSLHLPQDVFGEQLEILASMLDVVALDTLMKAPSPGRRPVAAITFDDAYQGAVTAGVAELSRRRLPATIFVAPAFVGGGSFWWDVVAPSSGHLDDHTRARLLGELAGDDQRVRAWAASTDQPMNDSLPTYARAATAAELAGAAELGITFGAHSWSHPNLACVDDDRLREELERPLAWLREQFPRAVTPWLAYPYGAEAPNVRAAAASAGYRGGLCITGGWHRVGEPPRFGIPRYNVPAAISKDGFRLRVAGLLA